MSENYLKPLVYAFPHFTEMGQIPKMPFFPSLHHGFEKQYAMEECNGKLIPSLWSSFPHLLLCTAKDTWAHEV